MTCSTFSEAAQLSGFFLLLTQNWLIFQEVGQLKRQTSTKHSHDSLDISAIKNADVISFGWYLSGLSRIVFTLK